MNLRVETKKRVYSVRFAKYGFIVSVLAKMLLMKMLLFVLAVMKLQKICKSFGLINVLRAAKFVYWTLFLFSLLQ